MVEAEEDDEYFRRVYGEGYRPQSREEKERDEEAARQRQQQEREQREKEREQRGRERERDDWRHGGGERKRDRERERDRDSPEAESSPGGGGGIPRDFRSKYSRVWDAKARASERHYNKRREDDLTCRTCGEHGHPTQACPSSLATRKDPAVPPFIMSLDDRRLRARLIGTGGEVIKGLERESGCRIRLDDNTTEGALEGSFIVRVMGPDKESVEKGEKTIKAMVLKLVEELKARGPPRYGPPRAGAGRGQGPGAPGVAPPLASIGGQAPGGQQFYMVQPDGSVAMQTLGGAPGGDAPYFYASGIMKLLEEDTGEQGMADMDMEEDDKSGGGGKGGGVVEGKAEGSVEGGKESSGLAPLDTSKVPATVEELERLAQQESADVAAAQEAEEAQEKKRHSEAMAEIKDKFEKRKDEVWRRQAKRRTAFLELQRLLAGEGETPKAVDSPPSEPAAAGPTPAPAASATCNPPPVAPSPSPARSPPRALNSKPAPNEPPPSSARPSLNPRPVLNPLPMLNGPRPLGPGHMQHSGLAPMGPHRMGMPASMSPQPMQMLHGDGMGMGPMSGSGPMAMPQWATMAVPQEHRVVEWSYAPHADGMQGSFEQRADGMPVGFAPQQDNAQGEFGSQQEAFQRGYGPQSDFGTGGFGHRQDGMPGSYGQQAEGMPGGYGQQADRMPGSYGQQADGMQGGYGPHQGMMQAGYVQQTDVGQGSSAYDASLGMPRATGVPEYDANLSLPPQAAYHGVHS